MLTLGESGTSRAFRSDKCVGSRSLERQERWKVIAIHHNGDLSSAELLFRTFISVNQLSVSTEQLRIVVENWLSKSQIMRFPAQETALAQVNEQLDCRLPPEVLSVKTTPLGIDVPAQGNLLRGHSERVENLPEDTRVIQMSNTAGFMRKISPRQFS